MAQPVQEHRALLAGLPDRREALERQRANLVQFVDDNAEAFAAMPYEPFTRVPSNVCAGGLQFDVRASTLRGLRGVYPHQPVPASSQEVRLLYYPGLLVTNALYEAFYARYYCPTGLELPALKYQDAHGNAVGVVIIGDPTCMGALVNDGRYGRSDGKRGLQRLGICMLRSVCGVSVHVLILTSCL